MKPFKVLLLMLFIASCNNDDISNDELKQYTGYYKIISFTSDIPVDLNNDTITSNELTNEINSFDFNDLEIRFNEDRSDETKLVSFFFPKTWITFQYPSNPEGYVEFIDYGFGTTYEFKNNSFTLKNSNYIEESYIDNVESNKTVELNNNLDVIDSNHLKLSIHKEFYDFNKKDWILLNIEIIYEKN